MKVDTGWFNDVIRKSPYGSQRRLAKKLRGRHGRSLDPSALSLMLRGKRAIQLHEARQFADLLDVPLVEVLRHAGVALPEEGTKAVPIIGNLDKQGELHLTHVKDKELVAGPGDLPNEAVAARWLTARSEQDLIDGWIIFADKPGPLTSEAISRFCLVQPRKMKPMAAFVLRGYKAGTVNLVSGMCSPTPRHTDNVQLEWVAPVLWIRPQV